jgi:hypothetical protein
MRVVNVLLSVLVSLAIGFGALEGGLRLLGFGPSESLTRFDPELGWSKRPNARVERSTSELDITIETNSIGLRDDELEDWSGEPVSDRRVLCLGDSFVLGYTVDRKDLFVDLLESAWTREKRNVQVINGGTEGWSTDQEVAWFLSQGAALAPDKVILFPFENDLYYCGEERYTRYPKPRFKADGSLEERTLLDPGRAPLSRRLAIGRFLHHLRTLAQGGVLTDTFEYDGVMIPREFAPLLVERQDFMEDAEARVLGAFKALKARCEELDAELIVCPIPSESAIDADERARFQASTFSGIHPDAWSPDLPVDLFLGAAQELGIRTIDPRPKLLEANESSKLYFEEEWHFTPAGNEALARILYDELTRGIPKSSWASLTPPVTHRPTLRRERSELPGWLPWYLGLALILGSLYASTYRSEERPLPSFLKVACLLSVVFGVAIGGAALLDLMPASAAGWTLTALILGLFGFVLYKLGPRIDTILELLFAFVRRGHWYLMPLVTILVTIGSLLLVAASSPLIAPFIYTLF